MAGALAASATLQSGGGLEQLSYGAFSADLHQRQAGERVPLQVSIEVTRRCPLECLHCYNNLPMGDMEAKRRELTKEEHFRVLDELVEMGCFWILYTGGEIFARKDFLEIYTYAKKKGFLITLFTNGTIINEQIADYLAEWPPFAIEITLYGRTRETYEALTAIPGSYDRCLRGIRLLKERGLPLKLKTVATSVNKHEVLAMRQFAVEEIGVEFKMDGQINPRIDCSQSPLGVRLTPEELVALDMNAPKGMSEYRRLAKRDLESPPNLAQVDSIYYCGGGMNGFAINAYGEIGICVISQQETFTIRELGVRAGVGRVAVGVEESQAYASDKVHRVSDSVVVRDVSSEWRDGEWRSREPGFVSVPCGPPAGGSDRG